ncbi:MAG: hypothetical protein U0Q22_00260 [Acidimicrobiales bacterium]
MGRRMIRRPTFAALVLAAAITLPVMTPAGAQTTTTTPASTTQAPASSVGIDVVSVSPWVEPDGTWTAHLRITGAPADGAVTYSIRQAVTGSEPAVRTHLAESRANGDTAKVLQRPSKPSDLASITGADGITDLAIAIRSKRSTSDDRVFIPASGVYPVVVSVVSGARDELATVTLYLDRLPSATGAPHPYRLGVVVHHEQDAGFDDRGEPAVTSSLRTAVGATVQNLIDGNGLALSLDLSPQSLVALTQSDVNGDQQLVDRLRRNLGKASVLRVPWAPLHVEGWASGGKLSDVQTALIDGQEALFARLVVPTEARTWPPDATVGPQSVALLGRLGISSLVVDPRQLTGARAPSGESGVTRPFRVGGGSASITAVSLDPTLQQLLSTGDRPAPLVAHEIVAQLFATWLADDRERGSVLQIDDTADPDVVAELLHALGSGAGDSAVPIAVVPIADVAALPAIMTRQGGKDVPWTRELVAPESTPRVAAVSRKLALVRPLIDDYAAMVPEGDPAATRLAITVQRSLDRRVTPGVEAGMLDDAGAEMRSDLDKISASDSRSLTVTSRRASIPLRFDNGLGRPIKVRLKLQSPRLDFTDGEVQRLTLNPGLNRLDVDVQVRASGQFVMQAELVAPGSDRVLASTRQRVRSTTFSGVGLMLSGGALLFLVVWWSRTLRRRSDTEDASVAEPASH